MLAETLELPVAYLQELFAYDPDTGVLTWRERPESHFKTLRACRIWNTRFAGKEAGTVYAGHNTQYRRVRIGGRPFLAHRVIWAMVTGEWPIEHIDHDNTNGAENHWTNLRQASNAENGRNCNRYSNNTSGITGVCWHKRARKWQAQIKVAGKNIHQGFFDNIEDAARARKAAEIKYGFDPAHGTQQRENS
jgi:hypothetical protein